jgi:adenosine deaminase
VDFESTPRRAPPLVHRISGHGSDKQGSGAERTAQELDRIRSEPLALHDFLKRMPKSADLHNHLDGAVYAETFIRVGAEDQLCIDTVAKAFSKSQPIKSGAEPEPACEAGDVPATDAFKNQTLYVELVDSFSIRGFVPSEAGTAHGHFFGTFAKFGGTDRSQRAP